jgi:hypothetical protein
VADKLFGLYGKNDKNFLTYNGKVIVHEDKAELEFLCPDKATVKGEIDYREVPKDLVPRDQLLPLREHPSMTWVRWPLNPNDFRRRD